MIEKALPAMTKEEALELLRRGKGGIREWNWHREEGRDIPALSDPWARG